MNKLKRTLAMVATLAISATAFVGCGDDKKKDTSATEATTAATEAAADTTAAEGGDTAATEAGDAAASAEFSYKGTLPTDGDKMTVLCWTGNDLDKMLPMWEEAKGIDAAKVNFVNFNVGGGEAAAKYDQYFKSGDDIDMLMVEADWALKYINDDTATTSLESLGFTETDFAGQYAYTQEIGRATDGANAGKLVGTSWQAAPGGWCYRTDLAETYLGVKTPDEMQALIGDWDSFVATAAKVSEASGGQTALTTTAAGAWQVFSAGRNTPWVADNKLTLDDSAKTYIDLAKQMYDNGYIIKDLGQWSTDWYAAGQTDTTMGYFVSTWGFGDAILSQAAGGEGGATYGKWNVVVGPQPFYWGGTWATVANRCNNPELAKEFIAFFTTNTEGATAYANDKGEYVSNKAAMANVIPNYAGLGVLGGQNHFEVLNVVADQIDMAGGITPYDSTIKTAFNDAVTAYCQGTYATADEAVAGWAQNVAAALPDLDYSNFEG
jgi:hypothetical protein